MTHWLYIMIFLFLFYNAVEIQMFSYSMQTDISLYLPQKKYIYYSFLKQIYRSPLFLESLSENRAFL